MITVKCKVNVNLKKPAKKKAEPSDEPPVKRLPSGARPLDVRDVDRIPLLEREPATRLGPLDILRLQAKVALRLRERRVRPEFSSR